MQPATIRRLLVFGVCLVAVSCLYLVPSMGGSSSRLSTPAGPRDARTTPPADPLAGLSNPGSNATSAESNPASPATPDPSAITEAATARSAGPGSTAHPADPTGSASTATQPAETRRAISTAGRPAATAVDSRTDHTSPTAISRLWTAGTDPEQLTLAWTKATDDRGSVWYEVWVNGFNVTTTQQPEATVAWFNDSSTHVVQVRAADLAGNRGPWSPTLMVTQPAPPEAPQQTADEPTASKTADAGTTPVATPTDGDSPKEDNS